MEEPLWDDSAYSRWVIADEVHQHGFKVLITGEGADELLGGYDTAYAYIFLDLLKFGPSAALVRELFHLPGHPDLPKLRSEFFRILGLSCRNAQLRWKDHQRVLGLGFDPALGQREAWTPSKNYVEYRKFATERFFLPYLLLCNDKISMAHSVEGRAPYLDVDFANLAYSIPGKHLLRKGLRKHILRKIMTRKVPTEILTQKRKVAFESPMSSYYLSPELLNRAAESFKSPRLGRWVEKKKILTALQGAARGDFRHAAPLIGLYWLESWARMFAVELE